MMVAYSFRERFIAPITKGLGREIIEGFGPAIPVRSDIRPKRQTIRALGKRRHARPGEILQLYYGMRTKQCRSIGVARCVDVRPISITFGRSFFDVSFAYGFALTGVEATEFAQADGFSNLSDMHQFWMKEHDKGTFYGVLIKWEPIHG